MKHISTVNIIHIIILIKLFYHLYYNISTMTKYIKLNSYTFKLITLLNLNYDTCKSFDSNAVVHPPGIPFLYNDILILFINTILEKFRL